MNSPLDFSIVRENPPAAATPPLSVPLNQKCETPKKDYRNAVKNSIAMSISPEVSTDVNNCVGIIVNAKNNSYPLQPSVKPKTNRNGKFTLLVVGDSHIKRVEKDLIIHHLNNKNVPLKCKSFDGADVRRIKHHLLPALHEGQIESAIIHGGTNDLIETKLHTTRPHDLAIKSIDIGNTCKSFGIKSIAISSILPRKDHECQKRIDETNSYLKDLCGFYGFSFINNSNINENFLHHDELHLNKVGSFVLGQNFVKHFNENLRHDEIIDLENHSLIVNSETLNPSVVLPTNQVDNACITEDINVENCNLSSSRKNLKIKNSNRLAFANLNINTINNKFEQLKHIIKKSVDVLVVTETKLGSSFPNGQFSIDGFPRPFRRDRNKNGGGVMIFVRDDIPAKEIKIKFLLLI